MLLEYTINTNKAADIITTTYTAGGIAVGDAA